MANRTELYNDVLNILGSTLFINNALTDNSPKTQSMNAAFDLCRREVLRQHDWNFARRRQELSLVGTNETEWEYQYAYPATCLKARKIKLDDRRAQKPIAFEVANYEDDDNGEIRVILTDQENATLIFTRDVEDLGLFDANAFAALAGLIAFRCHKTITTDKNASQVAWNYYQAALRKARAEDGNEQVPDEPNVADWTAGRNG